MFKKILIILCFYLTVIAVAQCKIAIVPFSVSDSSLQSIGENVSNYIMGDYQLGNFYRVIQKDQIKQYLNNQNLDASHLYGNVKNQIKIGVNEHIDYIVTGKVTEDNGIWIEASVYDVYNGTVLSSACVYSPDPTFIHHHFKHLVKQICGLASIREDLDVAEKVKIAKAPKPEKGKDFSIQIGVELTLEMTWVDGGSFMMGSDHGGPDEKPVHEVEVDGFWLCKYEVTQAMFRAVIGYNPSCFKGENLPVEMVSWDECQPFLQQLNETTGLTFSLPSEAQWEFAARGGNKSNEYLYAGSNDLDQVGWYLENADDRTHPIGLKKPNELGLYDMSGNVFEWCADGYVPGYYQNSPKRNPINLEQKKVRSVRGGGWHYKADLSRVANRSRHGADDYFNYFGFRLCLQ